MYNPEYLNRNRKNAKSVSAALEKKIQAQNQLIVSLEKHLQLQEELLQLQEEKIQDLTELNEHLEKENEFLSGCVKQIDALQDQLDRFMESGEIPVQERQE